MRPTWIDRLKARFAAAAAATQDVHNTRQAAYVAERLRNNRLI